MVLFWRYDNAVSVPGIRSSTQSWLAGKRGPSKTVLDKSGDTLALGLDSSCNFARGAIVASLLSFGEVSCQSCREPHHGSPESSRSRDCVRRGHDCHETRDRGCPIREDTAVVESPARGCLGALKSRMALIAPLFAARPDRVDDLIPSNLAALSWHQNTINISSASVLSHTTYPFAILQECACTSPTPYCERI